MNGLWRNACAAALIGLTAAGPLSGCTSRPAPRPESQAAADRIDPNLSTAVAKTASYEEGAGALEAVVLGKLALLAIRLNDAQPGGTQGGALGGRSNDPDYPGTSPGGGPRALQGPGSSVGTTPAMPGGGLHPGGATPGGTPHSTQAIPGPSGSQATSSNNTEVPSPTPGTIGRSPFDVMTRIANRIVSEHPSITEVRFATDPADAARLTQIAASVRQGGQPATAVAEVGAISARAVPAGTTPAQYKDIRNEGATGNRP